MRVLIYEPNLTGHHAPYLRHLVCSLIDLRQDVVVVTGRNASQSQEFSIHLQDVCHGIELDESGSMDLRSSYRYASNSFLELRRAIERHRPDHVWVPYADLLTEYLGGRALMGRTAPWPSAVELEGLFFRGRFAYPVERWRKHFTRALSRQLVPRANWHILHFLDPIAYGLLRQECPRQAARFRLMPDPVEAVSPMERAEARSNLGLPTDGRLIGCIGVLTERKGVDLLLAAFRRAKLGGKARLLLAGPMNDVVRSQVEQEFGDLLRSGRVIKIDRQLSVEAVMRAVMACDLVCVPNPYQMGSSSFVIRAAAAGRPVLASDFGWMGWAVSEFELGWSVNVRDTGAFAGAIQHGLENAPVKKPSPTTERFVRFHGAENFQAHWTARLRERLQMPPDDRYISWQSVLDDSSAKIGHM